MFADYNPICPECGRQLRYCECRRQPAGASVGRYTADKSGRVTVTLNGRAVASSRNLRGILDYNREHPVTLVQTCDYPDGSGLAVFTFYNGATACAKFADHTVLAAWILGRVRAFGRPLRVDKPAAGARNYVYTE